MCKAHHVPATFQASECSAMAMVLQFLYFLHRNGWPVDPQLHVILPGSETIPVRKCNCALQTALLHTRDADNLCNLFKSCPIPFHSNRIGSTYLRNRICPLMQQRDVFQSLEVTYFIHSVICVCSSL
ncbi:E3 ubiquitin-protein ligase MARCH2 [Platysternon megacephalum]|uniref:E3 ubiquitin-protein ligase MARCH2 n=1 Tax=Platysternon megacephalum TaxID=55544 RepID=A0A4D9E6K9_9SAUR|nr:E3 ubiquitin-protein ligase MARCH2 [Platysternon megacephalum]